jgi:hypothetical protein
LFILPYPPGSGWRQRCGIRWTVYNWYKDQERMILALVNQAGNMPLRGREIKK